MLMQVLQKAICPEKRRGMDAAESAIASVTEVRITSDLQVESYLPSSSTRWVCKVKSHRTTPLVVAGIDDRGREHAGSQGLYFHLQRPCREADGNGGARSPAAVSCAAFTALISACHASLTL